MNRIPYKRRGSMFNKRKSPYRRGGCIRYSGGYLIGPSHENGGIPVQLPDGSMIEVEGGEYIINAQTVDALGVPFLDKINSTATTYHTGGYGQGQLPAPSQYAGGGKIPYNRRGASFRNRRNPYRTGGRATRIPRRIIGRNPYDPRMKRNLSSYRRGGQSPGGACINVRGNNVSC